MTEIFPKRSKSHISEYRSYLTIWSKLPDLWIVREKPLDYGIDLEIEIVDEENNVLNKYLWVQVKAKNPQTSLDLKQRTIKYFANPYLLKDMQSLSDIIIRQIAQRGINIKDLPKRPERKKDIECIVFNLNVKYLHIANRSPLPFLLFIVSLETEKIYWINIKDYLDVILNPQKPDWVNNKNSIRIFIPAENTLEHEKAQDFREFLLYAERPLLYQHFNSLNVYIEYFKSLLNPKITQMIDKNYKIIIQNENQWSDLIPMGEKEVIIEIFLRYDIDYYHWNIQQIINILKVILSYNWQDSRISQSLLILEEHWNHFFEVINQIRNNDDKFTVEQLKIIIIGYFHVYQHFVILETIPMNYNDFALHRNLPVI